MSYGTKISFLFYSIFFLIAGCSKKELVPKTGSIYINVRDYNGRSVSNAVVSFSPSLPTATTDGFGTVLIKDVPVGNYEVIANRSGMGSGKALVKVIAGDISNTNIIIQNGVFQSFAPNVKIEFPLRPANYSIGEEVLFKGYVSDNDTGNELLDIKWESNFDGVINSNNADKDGVVTFKTNKLSAKVHIIKLIVKDKSGNIGKDSVIVSTLAPKAVVLNELEKINSDIKISWSKSTDVDFKEYRIYRSSNTCVESSKTLIATINNINQVEYIDKLVPFVKTVCYSVEVHTNGTLFKQSNFKEIENPFGLFLSYTPSDAVVHPSQPLIFLANREGGKIDIYNYESKNIIKTLDTPVPSGYLTLGNNGNGLNLYVPCTDNSIYIFDASLFTLKKTLISGAAATDVALLGNSIVAVSNRNQWTNPLVTFNENTGTLLMNMNSFCIYGGARLRKIPNSDVIMTISTGISPVDMDLILFDGKGNFVKCIDDRQHGDSPLDPNIFRISPKGNYVLTSSNGATYLTDESMKYLGQISRGSLMFSDYAFNDDGSVFYAGTSNRKSVQIGKYPELIRVNEILTKGFPQKLLKKGNTLYLVSKIAESSGESVIEVVDIPE